MPDYLSASANASRLLSRLESHDATAAFLLRPPGFGKSFLLDALQHEFTAASESPAPPRRVLRFDFSPLSGDASEEQLEVII